MDPLHTLRRRRVVHSRVVVVDPDPQSVEFTGRALARGPGITVNGAFATAREALDLVDWISVDVLLTEMDLPGTSALDLMAEALRRNPALRVVPRTSNESPTLLLQAIEAGAMGYLLKQPDEAALLGAVQSVLEGGSPISPGMARHLIQRLRPIVASPIQDSLSDREGEIVGLIAKGLQRKEVAEALGVSVHTIHAHMRSVHAKLRATHPMSAIRRGTQGENPARQHGRTSAR